MISAQLQELRTGTPLRRYEEGKDSRQHQLQEHHRSRYYLLLQELQLDPVFRVDQPILVVLRLPVLDRFQELQLLPLVPQVLGVQRLLDFQADSWSLLRRDDRVDQLLPEFHLHPRLQLFLVVQEHLELLSDHLFPHIHLVLGIRLVRLVLQVQRLRGDI